MISSEVVKQLVDIKDELPQAFQDSLKQGDRVPIHVNTKEDMVFLQRIIELCLVNK